MILMRNINGLQQSSIAPIIVPISLFDRAGQCSENKDCPDDCKCTGTIVNCSGKKLTKMPENIPTYVTDLRLSDNEITKIENKGLFKQLKNLKSLDLRNNKIG